jgi:hypothetical protein
MPIRHKIESLLVWVLPTFLYRLIGGFYGYLVSPTKSYSQYGEDLMIRSYFALREPTAGTYVDIGGFHPRWLSNTHLLANAGWSGVVVDIDAHKVRSFELLRSKCTGIIAAVFPGSHSVSNQRSVYRFRRLWSEIDTLSLADAQKYSRDTGIKFETDVVKVTDINSVLKKAVELYGKVRFLNIDIEGLDEAILLELDFDRFPVELICFENNQHLGGSARIKEILTARGYSHLFSARGTHGYAKD